MTEKMMNVFPELPAKFFDIYKRIGDELRHRNRFSLSQDLAKIAEDFISWHVKHKLQTVKANSVFQRARINQLGQGVAYEVGEMGAPPKGVANAGRINPEGISYLYVAC
jgi:hypothetical protein